LVHKRRATTTWPNTLLLFHLLLSTMEVEFGSTMAYAPLTQEYDEITDEALNEGVKRAAQKGTTSEDVCTNIPSLVQSLKQITPIILLVYHTPSLEEKHKIQTI
jgi:hypothetical protein